MTSICFRAAVLLAVLAVACDGDDNEPSPSNGAPGLKEACDAVQACEGTSGRTECEKLGAFVLSQVCFQAIEEASCEAHRESPASYSDTCFPPCDSASSRCNADGTITQCVSIDGTMRTTRSTCDAVCSSRSQRFAGTCGTRHGMSTALEDRCWCENESGQPTESPANAELPPGVAVMAAEAADGERACAAIWACEAHCDYDIDPELLSPQCLTSIEKASCEDHKRESPTYHDVCFPPCDEAGAYCNADANLTECTRALDGTLRWITSSCEKECALSSMQAVGCEVQGMPSRATCICEESR